MYILLQSFHIYIYPVSNELQEGRAKPAGLSSFIQISNKDTHCSLHIYNLHHSKLRVVDQRPTENQYLTQKLNLARLCATLLDSV
jgi:hypothetical protein